MWFVVAGVLLLVLKWAEIDPVTGWHWGFVLLPFGLAAVWWGVMDATGMTRKRAERKMEERKVARRQRDIEALGLDARRDKRVRTLHDSKARSPAKAPAAEPPRRDPRA